MVVAVVRCGGGAVGAEVVCGMVWDGSGRRLLVVRAGSMSQLPNDACRGLGAKKQR